MFEGDLEEGELEIGQIASLLRKRQAAAEIIDDIMDEYRKKAGNNVWDLFA